MTRVSLTDRGNRGLGLPLMARLSDQSVEFVGRNHAPLGVFPEWSCMVEGVAIRAGETLLLYTDGLTEAHRPRLQ